MMITTQEEVIIDWKKPNLIRIGQARGYLLWHSHTWDFQTVKLKIQICEERTKMKILFTGL